MSQKEKGLSAKYEWRQGRVKNIRILNGEIVGDFYETTSQGHTVVDINKVTFLNNKSKKEAQGIIDSLTTKVPKKELDKILS